MRDYCACSEKKVVLSKFENAQKVQTNIVTLFFDIKGFLCVKNGPKRAKVLSRTVRLLV